MFLSFHIKWSLTARAHAAALGVVIVVLCCVSSVSAQSMPGYKAPDKPKPAEVSESAKAAQGKAPLSKLYGHLKTDPSKVKRLGALDPRAKLKEVQEKIVRIGVVRPLAVPLDPLTDSAVYSVAEGDVRVGAVVSEGALYTRVHFKGMSLPAGARVFVYSADNPDEYYGPYEGHGLSDDGTFWTPPMKGDGVVIEYFVPKGAKNSQKIPFKVSEVVHVYTDPLDLKVGDCHNEVDATWTDTAKSVGRLDFVTGQGAFLCTGTLLADNVASSDIPYVLTANHCFSTQTEAQSLRVYWNYNTGNSPPGGAPFTDGADLLATGTPTDFTFVRLTGTLPGGLFFSGWDAATFSGSAAAAGIHHPDGSHKRISFGTARQPTGGECGSGFQCLAVDWSSGVTEPGSSGSGIWKGLPTDPEGAKLIGTLTGGPSACGAPPANLKDFYGRFSVTYPSISAFLEGTTCVTSLSPTSQNFSSSSGAGSFNVTAPGGCNWTAISSDGFVTITPPANGTGNGTVSFSVASNSGAQRSATIIVGGQVFNITQSGGGGCAPTPINIGQTVNGTLSPSDCPLGDGSFYDAYTFSATAGQQVSVFMSSTAFDTYLILKNPDGSSLSENDDGGGGTNSRIPSGSGFITLPTTGTYAIWANSFFANQTGAYSLTLNGSAPPGPRTLTVASANPHSGVSITVSATDNNGLNNGITQFTRTYNQGTNAILTAAATAGGNVFQKWQRDGVDVVGESLSTQVTMDTDHTMTAVYRPLNDYVLTIGSSTPDSGVSITVSPNDNGGMGNGDTQFTRTYKENTTVTLTAPITALNGNIFQKWRVDGQDFATNLFHVTMIRNITMIAIYAPPITYTLTVASSNPNSDVNITVSPNDQNGLGAGTTQFTRSYNQNTGVNLTAPATAPNGNIFSRWVRNGLTYAFLPTTNITMAANETLIAEYATKPVIYIEQGTTNTAAAVDSVTFVRGPFKLSNPNNFSSDQRTRIILFTSDLGLTQADLANPAVLVVEVPGFNFEVENVGPLAGVPGLTGSYIVVSLPNGLPGGFHNLTVRLNGVTSDTRALQIAQ